MRFRSTKSNELNSEIITRCPNGTKKIPGTLQRFAYLLDQGVRQSTGVPATGSSIGRRFINSHRQQPQSQHTQGIRAAVKQFFDWYEGAAPRTAPDGSHHGCRPTSSNSATRRPSRPFNKRG
jgi:hypothetical protein